MRKFYLPGLIILLNILVVVHIAAQEPAPRKGVVVSSPTGLKPRPDNLPIPNPNSVMSNSNTGRDIPDYIVYGTVFRMAATSWLPENVKFNPREAEICKRYRIEKILNEREEKILQELARKTVDDLNNLANRARPLTEEFRAKLRSGTPVQSEGRPTPPPELEEISKQRITLIEEAIAALKKKFSEKSFAKFTAFVDENIRSGFKTGKVNVPQ